MGSRLSTASETLKENASSALRPAAAARLPSFKIPTTPKSDSGRMNRPGREIRICQARLRNLDERRDQDRVEGEPIPRSVQQRREGHRRREVGERPAQEVDEPLASAKARNSKRSVTAGST